MNRLIRICYCLAFALVCLPSFAQQQLLDEDQLRDGWLQLFDGETLFGWEATSDADWAVVDGAIQVKSGQSGFLMTTSQFADYDLHVEYRAPADTNSGVFLRTPLKPANPATDCYELNIAPATNPFPTGSFVGRAKASAANGDSEQWHTFDIRAEGGRFTMQLDRETVLEYVDESPIASGHIALQLNQGEVSFRNIRLKSLGTKPIFNGKNLDGWNTDLAEASEFDVTDAGELRVVNGKGQLESNGRYGDFLLQLECMTNGDQLNSGVFFRCIPGELMNGYECQIHNGIQDGDPTKPVDGGTGGFYRRQPARRVMARDHEWFAMTLLADGPHFATWVNGVQVTDWTDTRPPHNNPRNGLRLQPGTLCIQGHDPTTDLLFRGLRIVELP
ncbi:MAG: DUF1080 domain-containing protein [Pirellulales bacterium]